MTTILTKAIPAIKLQPKTPIELRIFGLGLIGFWLIQFIGVDYLEEMKLLYKGSPITIMVSASTMYAPLILGGAMVSKSFRDWLLNIILVITRQKTQLSGENDA